MSASYTVNTVSSPIGNLEIFNFPWVKISSYMFSLWWIWSLKKTWRKETLVSVFPESCLFKQEALFRPTGVWVITVVQSTQDQHQPFLGLTELWHPRLTPRTHGKASWEPSHLQSALRMLFVFFFLYSVCTLGLTECKEIETKRRESVDIRQHKLFSSLEKFLSKLYP